MTTSPKQDAAAGRITDVTRRRLLEGLGRLCSSVPGGQHEFLTPQHTFWSGALPETDFLARLYPLSELPSTDSRYTTAFQDIVQHRIANDDWDRSASRSADAVNLAIDGGLPAGTAGVIARPGGDLGGGDQRPDRGVGEP